VARIRGRDAGGLRREDIRLTSPTYRNRQATWRRDEDIGRGADAVGKAEVTLQRMKEGNLEGDDEVQARENLPHRGAEGPRDIIQTGKAH
jgi:hypothetical protein